MISIGYASASDDKTCDKTKTLKKTPEQISHPYIEISGTETYQTNNDDYQRVIVKTTEGLISPESYKKHRINCVSTSIIN
jgi:hypothetical protein